MAASNITLNDSNHDEKVYYQRKTQAKVDLALKKIFLTTIVLLNLAAVGAAYVFVTQYCPIKAEPVIATSFIVGVVGGLVSLKIPTFGVNNFNLNQYLSPVTLLGRGLAYAFFGPTILVRDQMDWTNYADPATANQISGELKSDKPFEFFAENYGPHIRNLAKYGFLKEESLQAVQKYYADFIPLKMQRDYHLFYAKRLLNIPEKMTSAEEILSLFNEEDPNSQNTHVLGLKEALEGIKKLDDAWNKEKGGFFLYPSPQYAAPNFKKWHVQFYHNASAKLEKRLTDK